MRSQLLISLQGPRYNTLRADDIERKIEAERSQEIGCQAPGAR